MLEPLVNFFDKLIDQFTWSRLIFILMMFVVVAGMVYIYEDYTQSLKLDRLNKSITLIEKSSQLPASINIDSQKSLSNSMKNITKELERMTSEKASKSFEVPPVLMKIISAAVPWLSLLLLIVITSDKKEIRLTLSGMAILAIPLVIVGAILPDMSPFWLNTWAYPIVSFLFGMSVILFFSLKKP